MADSEKLSTRQPLSRATLRRMSGTDSMWVGRLGCIVGIGLVGTAFIVGIGLLIWAGQG